MPHLLPTRFVRVPVTALAALIFTAWSATAWAEVFEGKVVRILDGDTIEVLVDQHPRRVRLASIDAPEKKQPFGEKSRQTLAGMVYLQPVRIHTEGNDQYGRVIGDVFVGESNVNARMVVAGMAWVYRQYSHDVGLIELERTAREQKIGLWADSHPMQPWTWRRQAKRVGVGVQSEKILTMTERLARYETALEILGFMVAIRSELIGNERRQSEPNPTTIAALLAEQVTFAKQQHMLVLDDDEAIEHVIGTYGPIVKAAFRNA